MLKKLKTRFVIGTIIALAIVLMLIVGAINAFNYQSVVADADGTLELIMENAGRFPSHNPDKIPPNVDITLTPESPFESRYFSVVFVGNTPIAVNTSSIAAINDTQAIEIGRLVLSKEATQGFYKNYRYLIGSKDGRTRVIFLDCTRLLDSANTFLWLSVLVSLVSVVAVFILLWLISDKIVNPMVDGYEKQKTFITNAGHDIKTPITIIDADAELLEMEIGENEWLKDIKKQAARLATLTGELIYLSRMEEQEHTTFVDFPISEVIEEVVSSFGAPAKTKNITLNSYVPPAIYYKGDEGAIKKLITLLLDNAIKYSPDGETVSIALKKTSFGLTIRISNVATNTASLSVKHMFDRFYRSDEARGSGGGFGIGLSVASAIVSAHRGRISAEKQGEFLIIDINL